MRIEANELTFHVVDEGEGPVVLLLHGFPDSSALWRYQVPALVEAGYRVIAPDLRGFGESDKPAEVEAYSLPNVVGDVLGILDGLGVERASVVGHDWGAAVAWALGALTPDRVERLAALSVGHPAGFFSGGWEQRQRSWYMLFFLFEGVAEEGLQHDDWRLLREMTAGGDVDRYVTDLARPGALTAALNWYRANIRPEGFAGLAPSLMPPVSRPALGIWSSGDIFLAEKQMKGSATYVQGPWRYERIDGASHWIPFEAPDRVTELLLDFLRAVLAVDDARAPDAR